MKENQYVKLIILRLWEQTPVPLFVFEELMSVVAVSRGNPPRKASCEFQSVADADCDTGVEISERASA